MPLLSRKRRPASQFFSDYGMLGVLLALCVYFSFVTLSDQTPSGRSGGLKAADQAIRLIPNGAPLVIVSGPQRQGLEFADAVASRLSKAGVRIVARLAGNPGEVQRGLRNLVSRNTAFDAIVASSELLMAVRNSPAIAGSRGKIALIAPDSYRWPTFLGIDNLLNVANQIVVIAIIAAGSSLVILTGGIDLSSGSLAALAAVIACLLIRSQGAENAPVSALFIACGAAVLLCGFVGVVSGSIVALLRIPPFIVTLAMMQVGGAPK